MTDWVAYMSDDTKASRKRWYNDLNFRGTSDWAIDLQKFLVNSDKTDDMKDKTQFTVKADWAPCVSSGWPKTLSGLESKFSSIPNHCRGLALARVLFWELETAIKEYNEVSSSKDYDEKFGYYEDWVKDAINTRLEAFMGPGGTGLKYMDCKWETQKAGSGEGACDKMYLGVEPGAHNGMRKIEFTMRNEEGFYKALAAEAGIDKSWIQWIKSPLPDPCMICNMADPQCQREREKCLNDATLRVNFPQRITDTSKIKVTNPKEIVDEAIPRLEELGGIALAAYTELAMTVDDIDPVDIVTSLSMPLFMLQDASESIKEIKKIGKEQKEQKTKELVMMILTIVFAVIPFAGEAALALGGASRVATAALIVGEAGNAAITIAEVVDDPTSAPFAVLGMLLGAGGLRAKGPQKAFKDAADARRALNSDDLALFGKEFVRKDRIVQNMVKRCMRRG